jgi:hypothetical protein
MEADGNIAVTALHALMAHIHTMRYIAVDITYQHVKGADACNFAGFIPKLQQREYFPFYSYIIPTYHTGVILATIYTTRATRTAFFKIFSAFAQVVQTLTGYPLCFTAINGPGLDAMIVDADVAQAQGFGDWLFSINNPDYSKLHPSCGEDLLPYALRLCSVHYER